MKRFLLLITMLFVATASYAQTTYSVTLNWAASTSSTPAAPGTVTVYRATGTCPASGLGTLTYTALTTTAPDAGPYTDATVASGSTYCYYAEAVIGGASSAPSNTFSAVIPAAVAPITGLKGTVVTVTVQ